MKTLAIALLAALLPTASMAVIDPDPDLLGIYFDTEADNNCLQVASGTAFTAYVILTNTSQAGVEAFEFGYENEFDNDFYGLFVRLSQTLPSNSIDVGSGDASSGFVQAGLAYPLPAASALVLVTWKYMALDTFPVLMYLGPADNPSLPDGMPVIQNSDHELMAVGIIGGNPNRSVAAVNGVCGAEEDMNWGTLKSNFR